MTDATGQVVGLIPVAMAAGIAMKVTDSAFKTSSKPRAKSRHRRR